MERKFKVVAANDPKSLNKAIKGLRERHQFSFRVGDVSVATHTANGCENTIFAVTCSWLSSKH